MDMTSYDRQSCTLVLILTWTQYLSSAGHDCASYLRIDFTAADVSALRHTHLVLRLMHVLAPLVRMKRLGIFLLKDLCGCDKRIRQARESTTDLMPPRGCTKGASLLPAAWKGKLML